MKLSMKPKGYQISSAISSIGFINFFITSPQPPAIAGQALSQVRGAIFLSICALPPSLPGEGGKGDEVNNHKKVND